MITNTVQLQNISIQPPHPSPPTWKVNRNSKGKWVAKAKVLKEKYCTLKLNFRRGVGANQKKPSVGDMERVWIFSEPHIEFWTYKIVKNLEVWLGVSRPLQLVQFVTEYTALVTAGWYSLDEADSFSSSDQILGWFYCTFPLSWGSAQIATDKKNTIINLCVCWIKMVYVNRNWNKKITVQRLQPGPPEVF